MIEKILQNEFGLTGASIEQLDGYENRNYLVTIGKDRFVFKTYPSDHETLELIDAEIEVLHALLKSHPENIPRPIPFKDGSFVKTLKVGSEKSICRMLSFLSGKFLGESRQSEEMVRSLGRFLAGMDIQMMDLRSSTLRARKWEWDIQYLDLNKKFIPDIPDAAGRKLVRYFLLQFEESVLPLSGELRKSVIHNDANEWNVLVSKGIVSGIIDFGDLAHSFLVNEVAIAMTYAAYDKEDPLHWCALLLEAYNRVLPLNETEISILYYLVAARLCLSVCNSAHSRKARPGNEYNLVSEKPAWEMLWKWIGLNPGHAENTFRAAAGMPPIEVPRQQEQLSRRRTLLPPVLSLSYEVPVSMEKAAFQYMYDSKGNTFLDAYNNIPHVGHSHPAVVEAGRKQMARLNTNTRYVYDLLHEYAERLLAKFPEPLDKVLFVNSGSAAADLAVRMARAHTGRLDIMVMEHGYHGHTGTCIDISDYKFSHERGQGQKGYILKTTIPDTYRGKYTVDDGSAGKLYGRDAAVLLRQYPGKLAAFICEPVVGCGGQVPLARGYLKELYPAIRSHGAVCISDEVQVGFGRMGDYFWGFEAQEVIPDIVILGKPMGNGHPIGAVICTSEIAESFSRGVEFFSSFGGNPVSCAIGLAVLDVIEEEKLQDNAKTTGKYYLSLFRELQKEFPCIGDVRGSGLFIGVDLVSDPEKTAHTELAAHVKNRLRERHILIGTDGPYDHVLKSKPPLCFTRQNAERVVSEVNEILKEFYSA